MARRTVLLLSAAALLAAPTAALAGSPNHDSLPSSDDPKCVAHARAYIAQTGSAFAPGEHGLGGVARAMGISVSDGQLLVRTYCATGVLPAP